MEQVKKDVFKISLGNIAPKKEVSILIKYATELTGNEFSMKFH